MAQWLDLRNNADMRALGHDEIEVSVKTADVTHPAMIHGVSLMDFADTFRNPGKFDRAFFQMWSSAAS